MSSAMHYISNFGETLAIDIKTNLLNKIMKCLKPYIVEKLILPADIDMCT